MKDASPTMGDDDRVGSGSCMGGDPDPTTGLALTTTTRAAADTTMMTTQKNELNARRRPDDDKLMQEEVDDDVRMAVMVGSGG